MAEKLSVIKVVLKTKKVVLLREIKVSDTDTAVEMACGKTASESKYVIAMATQRELLRLLLISVDGKTLKPNEKEDLNSLFKVGEYNQMMKVLDHISEGGAELGKDFTVEIATNQPAAVPEAATA